MNLQRRDLLKGAGALVVSFVLPSRGQGAEAATKSVSPDDVGAFIAIDSQGMLTFYSGKVELGTGVFTALTQIMAEELSLPMDRVKTIQGDTRLTPDQGPTYASLTIQDGGPQIRRAAATAREALLHSSARPLKLAKAQNTNDKPVGKT
jgi:CO/xanthine dehydrogenase Mo-binding subunit